MPTSRFNVVALAAMGIMLPVILIPLFTLAAPTISQEFTRSPMASTPDASPGAMTRKEIFDLVFALVLFLLIIGLYTWLGGCFSPTPLGALVNEPRVRGTYRTLEELMALLRLDTLLQWLADAIVGTGATPATDGGGIPPPTQIPPPRLPTLDSDTRPGGATATPYPATSPSDHHHLAAHPSPV